MKEKHNKTHFEAPQGYFEEFEDRLMLRLMEENLPASPGFGIPEGYLDNLDDSLLQKATASDRGIISLFSNRRLHYAVAAAACLVLAFTLFRTVSSTPDITLADVPVNSVESFITEGESGIDTYDVLALMNEEEIDALTLGSELISEESLEDYIIENLNETSLLIE